MLALVISSSGGIRMLETCLVCVWSVLKSLWKCIKKKGGLVAKGYCLEKYRKQQPAKETAFVDDGKYQEWIKLFTLGWTLMSVFLSEIEQEGNLEFVLFLPLQVLSSGGPIRILKRTILQTTGEAEDGLLTGWNPIYFVFFFCFGRVHFGIFRRLPCNIWE